MPVLIEMILYIVGALVALALFFVVIPANIIILILQTLKIKRLCNFSVATFYDSTFVVKEEVKRDRINDDYHTEYRSHFFSPDEIIHYHTKAYKTVVSEYYECKYRYIVDGEEYFTTIIEGCEPFPETLELFYERDLPTWCLTKENYLSIIYAFIINLTAFWVICVIYPDVKLYFFSWLLIMLGYVIAFKMIKKTKEIKA